jgi:hypothetical protein
LYSTEQIKEKEESNYEYYEQQKQKHQPPIAESFNPKRGY